MSEELEKGSVSDTGSLEGAGNDNPNKLGELSQPGKNADEKNVPIEQYKELETKLGQQGKELGEYRSFVKELEPLLEKLQGNDEMVEAILAGKFDSNLAKAVLEGKVTVGEAEKVAQANEEVKKDLGKEAYDKADPAKIEKLIAEKVEEATKSMKKTLDDSETRRNLEKEVEDFVSKTPDFDQFAEGISKFFAEHPDQYDVRIAYNAVKGAALAAEKEKNDEIAKAEMAKRLAANAGAGGSQAGPISVDKSMADVLIAPHSSPNRL